MIAEANLPLDRLTTLCAQMTKATNDFRRCINEAKELHVRQIEKMQQERDAALLAARVHEDNDDPNHMNQIPGMEMPPSKKVITTVICPATQLNNESTIHSAPTAIARPWPNAHCAGGRRTARRSASARTGTLIKWNALVIRTKEPSRLCCWSRINDGCPAAVIVPPSRPLIYNSAKKLNRCAKGDCITFYTLHFGHNELVCCLNFAISA